MRRHDPFVPEESKTRRPDPFVPAVIDICRKPSKCITLSIHFRVCYSRRGGGGTSGADEIGQLIFDLPCPQEIGQLIFDLQGQNEIGQPTFDLQGQNEVGPPYFEPTMPGWARMGGGRAFSTGT